LDGASHANGGIYMGGGVEAEGGEAVINRNSTNKFLPLLSAINEAGGGRSLMANGGILPPPVSQSNQTVINNTFDTNGLAQDIANALGTQQVVVLEKDISGVQKTVRTIENNLQW